MIKLEKMDVARRQYRAALELWFADGDPVAIHTLAMAANEVLTDVAEHRGLNHLSSDFITDVISKALSSTPEEAHRLRTSSANFFKHADRDPDDELEFDPEWNVPILAWSLVCLLHMHESFALVERAFWMRLAVEQPNRYRLPIADGFDADLVASLRKQSRPAFWTALREADEAIRHQAAQPPENR